MHRRSRLALSWMIVLSLLLTGGLSNPAAAQTKPEGEMRWALYVTLAPAWFDPAEVVGVLTPFWVLYAMHDALVKPMPGNHLTPSLAESWTVSADQRVYDFKLREGLKIVPKKYVEQVGLDGFKKNPVGLGPYKFVSSTPGIELVMEAYEGYWRKMPSVKRLVYKSVPESTTRLAMLKRGEVDLAYLLDAPQAMEVKRDPTLKLVFSGGIGTYYLDFFDQWDAKSPWHDRRVRLAASLAMDRKALSEAETVGASRPTGNVIPRKFEFALPIEPPLYDPAKAKQLLAEAGYPNGFDAGELYPWPPYFSMGESVGQYLGAVGIKVRLRTMERAAFYAALQTKKLKGLCVCINAVYGNAASRLAETVPSNGAFAYGGYPDIDALYQQQSRETDRRKREAQLHLIQRQLNERVRFAPIMEYIWPSAVGPRVADPALMLIDPYPWSAPLEEVRLKKN